MSEFEMLRRLRALRVDREPARELWSAIAAQLGEPAPWRANAPPRRLLWPWATAATVALAVGMGVMLTRSFRTLGPTPDAVTSTAAAEGMSSWALHEASALEMSYAGAVDATLRPAQRAAIERARPDLYAAASEIDFAADEIERALERHPNAVHLLKAMKRTQDQRLRVARLEAGLG